MPSDAVIWEKVIRKLRTRAMPPVGLPAPDGATSDAIAAYLEKELDQSAAVRPRPGRLGVHRLNRAEYANSVRDLLGLDIDVVALLPPDEAGYGFDNIGDVLTVSPLLMERYMSAATKVTRLALGQTPRPDLEKYTLSRFYGQQLRESDDLPFGSRGGAAIRHYFPVDAQYLIKIRLKGNFEDSAIVGLSEPHQLDVRLDGARLRLFGVGGPEQAGLTRRGTAQPAADDNLEIRLPIKAGTHVIAVAFLQSFFEPEDLFRPRLASQEVEQPSVGSITIGGPYEVTGPGDTASRRKIFVCRPAAAKDEEACADKIITSIARRAYRRPLAKADIPRLLAPYKYARRDGDFEAGIELALQRILLSPEFLFRIERDPVNTPAETAYRISNLELASRLSFFLWSSIPDDELLSAAEGGKLKDPVILKQHVLRMLADPKSKALVENFGGQWLYIRNVRTAQPDLANYPEFDENLRQAFRQETELFLASSLREDQSVLNLLSADYTYLNERLARNYGVPNVYGGHFRRVAMNDPRRQGILGHGSVLMGTSYANRTSPTIRGKWVLENLLAAPPPSPPANVPSLKDRREDGKLLSVRQQLETHRSNPVCASCHAQMDPLGYALDNFDVIGRWRTVSGVNKEPIDASATLPDGTTINGPSDLRKLLLSKPDQFVGAVTEKLLTYSLGRGVDHHDQPAVRKIIRDAQSDNYRWSSLILGVVSSAPFQMREAPPAAVTTDARLPH